MIASDNQQVTKKLHKDTSELQHYFTFFFFFNDTATTEIYTLSLHDALPIYQPAIKKDAVALFGRAHDFPLQRFERYRSEEHTSELQSQFHLVCRLLLEKKK